MERDREIVWIGSSLRDLRLFPAEARQDCGFQLESVQRGEDPDDWKPMADIGKGCREIRVASRGGAYRVLYVATLGAKVFVLHAFVKKSRRTSMPDIDLGRRRYREAQRIATSEGRWQP